MGFSVARSCTAHKRALEWLLYIAQERKTMLSSPQLLRGLKGQVLTPEDPAYDEARTVVAARTSTAAPR
jgi:hypothetical protein